jgi:hypothetical protein
MDENEDRPLVRLTKLERQLVGLLDQVEKHLSPLAVDFGVPPLIRNQVGLLVALIAAKIPREVRDARDWYLINGKLDVADDA